MMSVESEPQVAQGSVHEDEADVPKENGQSADQLRGRYPPLAIGIANDDGSMEWGISFNGPNPEEKDFVAVETAALAHKLAELIQLYCPQSRSTIRFVSQSTNSAGSN